MTTLDLALSLVKRGISVIPILPTGKKAPSLEKGNPVLLRERIANEQELRQWFGGRPRGIAALCGKPSGNLECLDFDEPGLVEQWAEDVERISPGLLQKLVMVKTPKGGAHAWYRCESVGACMIVARRHPSDAELVDNPSAKFVKLVETRSHGGYALLPGSPAACHEWNKEYQYTTDADISDVQTISPEEREVLLDTARSFNTYTEQAKQPRPRSTAAGLQPGDDYDVRGDWQKILEPLGWKLFSGDWNNGRITRPGKDTGISATIGKVNPGPNGEPLLHVFSTSADIGPGTYGRFRAMAALYYKNDLSAAAKALAQKGYGSQQKARANGQQQRYEQQDPEQTGYELVLSSLRGRKARPVHYLVEGKIPVAKVSMIAGVGGTGKSSLTRHLIACLTSGRPAFGLDYEPPPPCDVLLASVEDSPEDTIVPHLVAEGANLERVICLEGVRKKLDDKVQVEPFNLMDVNLVLEAVRQRSSIKVLVIDPIMSFVGRAGVDENASAKVRTLLDPLIGLAERTGMAVILIAHLNKATNVQAVNRIAGSTAFRDACRVVFAYGADPDDETKRILAPVKANPMGFDRRSLAFKLKKLGDDQLAEVLADEAFSDLSERDLDRIGKQLAVIVPLGASECDADGIVGSSLSDSGPKVGRPQQSETSAQEACAEWIKQRLGTEFCWRDSEIEAEAMAQRVEWTNWIYRRAKKRVPGLSFRKCGFGKDQYYLIGIGAVEHMTIGNSEIAQHAQHGESTGKQGNYRAEQFPEIAQHGANSPKTAQHGETLKNTAIPPAERAEQLNFSEPGF